MINNENNFKNDKIDRNFCGSLYNGVDGISEGDGCKVDEELIKEKFDNIHEKIISHDERITKIEMGMVQQQESLKYVIKNQEELNDSIKMMDAKSTTSNNLILGSLNSLIINKQNNETQITTTKIEGKSKIRTQTIITIGAVITTLISSGVAIYTVMHQSSKLLN